MNQDNQPQPEENQEPEIPWLDILGVGMGLLSESLLKSRGYNVDYKINGMFISEIKELGIPDLHKQLELAINNERFEEAAELRDIIKKKENGEEILEPPKRPHKRGCTANHYILEDKKLVKANCKTFHKKKNSPEWNIGEFRKDNIRVSTIFLGEDYNESGLFGEGEMFFETMIFGGPWNRKIERYATYEDAEAGHEQMVKAVKKHLWKWRIMTWIQYKVSFIQFWE